MAVVKQAGIEAEKHEQSQCTARLWRPHRDVMRFLQDHFPEEWYGDDEKIGINECKMKNFRVQPSKSRRGYYKVMPTSCNRLPYCITCVGYKEWKRTNKRMDRFHCCTPGGEEPRFIQLNFAAPVKDDHTGVGMAASQDIGEFGKAVWETLVELYGDGIGAEMSYHDFGERGFAKRYPHMDITLNGWMLDDQTAVHTPRIELKGGSANKVWAAYIRALSKRWHVSKPDKEFIKTSKTTRFLPATQGRGKYRKALRYQCRELVDLRKLEYDRSAGKVWWKSYKHNVREPFDVADFIEGLEEYNERLCVWQKGRRNMLHRRYGHMSDRTRKATQQLVGGVHVPHGKDCSCSRCEDWGRVYPSNGDGDPNGGTLEDRL